MYVYEQDRPGTLPARPVAHYCHMRWTGNPHHAMLSSPVYWVVVSKVAQSGRGDSGYASGSSSWAAGAKSGLRGTDQTNRIDLAADGCRP
jgi:hypothetical protein